MCLFSCSRSYRKLTVVGNTCRQRSDVNENLGVALDMCAIYFVLTGDLLVLFGCEHNLEMWLAVSLELRNFMYLTLGTRLCV